jgi:hypothetical protein
MPLRNKSRSLRSEGHQDPRAIRQKSEARECAPRASHACQIKINLSAFHDLDNRLGLNDHLRLIEEVEALNQ